MLKAIAALSLLFITPFIFARQSNQTFNRTDYYHAMSVSKLDLLNQQVDLVKTSTFSKKEAFEGALLMRKAGLLQKTKEKLDVFKSGHKKLESAINKDDNDAELRFLRLIIQENAPKVVKYSGNVDEDRAFIKANYKRMPAEAQKALVDYARISKVLHVSDF